MTKCLYNRKDINRWSTRKSKSSESKQLSSVFSFRKKNLTSREVFSDNHSYHGSKENNALKFGNLYTNLRKK